MSERDRSHLSPLPGPNEELVLTWLAEPDPVSSARVIDRALVEITRAPQSQPRPWDGLRDALRPEPFGRNLQYVAVLLAMAGLTLAVIAVALVGGSVRTDPNGPTLRPPSGLPSESPSHGASPTSVAVFPLAGEPIEFVVNEGTSQGANSSATGSLSVIRADGTGRRVIARDVPGDLVWPEWMPGQDTVLALQGTYLNVEQIWAIDATGTTPSQVLIPCVTPCGSRNEAAVSHDGSKVVFFQAWGKVVNGIPEQCGLSVYDFATQAIHPLTDHGCGPAEERHSRFSADDRSLAFWRSNAAADPAADPNARSAIFIRDVATGKERQLTDWALDASQLDWSPDGAWIVFVQRAWDDRAPHADLWRVRIDGTGVERLTSLDTSTSRLLRPQYSPDGRWILFLRLESSGGALLAIPSDGGASFDVLPGIQSYEHDERVLR